MTAPIDDEFTELRDADIPRVDLVDKSANGMRFLIAKREDGAGLLDPEFVRDLIAKADPDPAPTSEETVTMTGSPGAIAKFIHQAAQRREVVAKAKYNADDLKRMAANGEAMKDESYPIADRDDLDRAIRAVGRGGADHDAIRRHVIARAKALGASSEIPDNWAADGSLKEGTVSKTMALDDNTGELDPTTVLVEPDGDAPGSPTDPGSPAWEAIDAATARKWTSILARAKVAVDLLSDREMLEAASGDEDDAMQAMDLADACCAIDYAISVLAPFAVAEQSEADCGADEMAMVGKALGSFDGAALDTIEALGQVRKAGRVLSAANEAAIRGAAECLQKVLASLPSAPTAPDDGQSVAKTKAKETDVPPTTNQTPAAAVTKADGEKPAIMVVYDQKGRLVGVVDPDKVTPVANSEADAGDGDAPADGASDTTADAAPAAAPDPADLTPAPAAEVGTPADAVPDDGVTKQTTNPNETNDTTSEDVLKSIADGVAKQFEAYSATQEQVIAKQAETMTRLAETIEVLKGQVQALEEQPAVPRVFTNGAVPPAHQLRGQDQGAGVAVDTARARELKKGLYGGPDAGDQNRIAGELQQMAIDRLQQIHHGGARQ